MPVRIITDSGSEYQSSDHPALEVLPLTVAFGDDVVVITMSSVLSGTYQSACIAAEAARGKGTGTVRVVDSLNMTLGERIVVQYALQLLDAGATADEIADALEANVGRVHIFGLIDTLEYLKRGGRISAAAGTVGELLSIKPVITVTDGAVVILGKARGAKGGRTLLHREIANVGGVDFAMPGALGYSGASDAKLRKYLDEYRDLWEGAISEEELPISQVGAAIGCHVGPGGIAVAFYGKES